MRTSSEGRGAGRKREEEKRREVREWRWLSCIVSLFNPVFSHSLSHQFSDFCLLNEWMEVAFLYSFPL